MMLVLLTAAAVLVSVVTGEVPREDLGWAIAAAAVFAAASGAVGSAVFVWGIRRLNRRGHRARS